MANNVMNTDGGIPPFRFWCQHVLPLVYDDSLSYMELLCKVINYLNEMSEKIKSIDPYMSELTQEFIALKEYVDNFVDNLDIESAVDQKIEELIASGDFTDLVSPTMYTGKSIVWYGDSWGTTTDNVVDEFDDMFGQFCTITNRCIGGTTLTRLNATDFPDFSTNSGVQRITAAEDLGDFDYCFIMYGVNDWQTSTPIMNDDKDEYAFESALNMILTHITTQASTCKPVVILPTYVHRASLATDVNHMGCSIHAYINHAIEVCKRFGVRYINLYNLCGINKTNYTHFLRNDTNIWVHPMKFVSNMIAKYIWNGCYENGNCYGDDWSGNIVSSMIPVERTNADYYTRVSNFPYLINRKLAVGHSAQSWIVNSSRNDKTVVRMSGWFKGVNNAIGGIYIKCNNADQTEYEELPIQNITSDGYFECYVEFNRCDLIAPYITTDGEAYVYGFDIRVLNGDANVYGLTLSTSTALTRVQGSPELDIINGVAYYKGGVYTALADMDVSDNIINLQAWSSFTKYVLGFNQTKNKTIIFYTYQNMLKTANAIENGDTIIIPELIYPIN